MHLFMNMKREEILEFFKGQEKEKKRLIKAIHARDSQLTRYTIERDGIEKQVTVLQDMISNLFYDEDMNVYRFCKVCHRLHLEKEVIIADIHPYFSSKDTYNIPPVTQMVVCKRCIKAGYLIVPLSSLNPDVPAVVPETGKPYYGYVNDCIIYHMNDGDVMYLAPDYEPKKEEKGRYVNLTYYDKKDNCLKTNFTHYWELNDGICRFTADDETHSIYYTFLSVLASNPKIWVRCPDCGTFVLRNHMKEQGCPVCENIKCDDSSVISSVLKGRTLRMFVPEINGYIDYVLSDESDNIYLRKIASGSLLEEAKASEV